MIHSPRLSDDPREANERSYVRIESYVRPFKRYNINLSTPTNYFSVLSPRTVLIFIRYGSKIFAETTSNDFSYRSSTLVVARRIDPLNFHRAKPRALTLKVELRRRMNNE